MWHTWSLAEVLVGSTCGTFALHQQCAFPGWRADSQLIEGDNFTAGSQDAGTCLFGHTQSTQFNFRHFQQAIVVRDGTNNDNGLLRFAAGLQQTCYFVQRQWWQIGTAHKQTLQHDFVELLVCTSVQETVQL